MPTFTKTFRQIREMKDFSATLWGGTDGFFIRYNNSTGLFDLAAVPPPPSTYPIGQINGVTPGSVLFGGAAGAIAQDNANLFWDDTNNRLGVGTITPGATLQVNGAASGITAIFRANATTPGNLTEWQNSSAAVVAWIGPPNTANQYLTVTIPSGGVGEARLSCNTSYGAAVHSTFAGRGGVAFHSKMYPVDNSGVIATDGTYDIGQAANRFGALYSVQGNFINSTAGNVVLTVKLASSQTANALEVQNSSGVVLSSVSSSGNIVTPSVSFGSSGWKTWYVGGYYTVELNGSPTIRIDAAGKVHINGLSDAQVNVIPYNAASIGVIVQGQPSQTANLQEWQNSSATPLLWVTSAGALRSSGSPAWTFGPGGISDAFGGGFNGITLSCDGGNTLSLQGGGSSNSVKVLPAGTSAIVLVVKAAPSQTGNLTEWQDSSAAALSYVKPTGAIAVPDDAYSSSWNGSVEVPTKNAVYDKIQQIANDVLFDHFADASNAGTSETDLYSDTLAASQLGNNGEKLIAQYSGTFSGDGTSTQRVKAYFGGTQIFDSGALSVGVTTTYWDLYITVIRESSSVTRCSATLNTSFASLAAYAVYTKVTGLTLTNTQIVKVTGTAAGVTGASNQITASEGYVEFKPAA